MKDFMKKFKGRLPEYPELVSLGKAKKGPMLALANDNEQDWAKKYIPVPLKMPETSQNLADVEFVSWFYFRKSGGPNGGRGWLDYLRRGGLDYLVGGGARRTS